jgi:hypothetical protein
VVTSSSDYVCFGVLVVTSCSGTTRRNLLRFRLAKLFLQILFLNYETALSFRPWLHSPGRFHPCLVS